MRAFLFILLCHCALLKLSVFKHPAHSFPCWLHELCLRAIGDQGRLRRLQPAVQARKGIGSDMDDCRRQHAGNSVIRAVQIHKCMYTCILIYIHITYAYIICVHIFSFYICMHVCIMYKCLNVQALTFHVYLGHLGMLPKSCCNAHVWCHRRPVLCEPDHPHLRVDPVSPGRGGETALIWAQFGR